MLRGNNLRLCNSTLAIEFIGSRGLVWKLPAGIRVKVVGPATDDEAMLDVICLGRPMVMYADDVAKRCEDVSIAAA